MRPGHACWLRASVDCGTFQRNGEQTENKAVFSSRPILDAGEKLSPSPATKSAQKRAASPLSLGVHPHELAGVDLPPLPEGDGLSLFSTFRRRTNPERALSASLPRELSRDLWPFLQPFFRLAETVSLDFLPSLLLLIYSITNVIWGQHSHQDGLDSLARNAILSSFFYPHTLDSLLLRFFPAARVECHVLLPRARDDGEVRECVWVGGREGGRTTRGRDSHSIRLSPFPLRKGSNECGEREL